MCLWETPGDLWPAWRIYINIYPIPGFSLATLNTLLGTVSGEVNAAERARPVSSEVLALLYTVLRGFVSVRVGFSFRFAFVGNVTCAVSGLLGSV